MTKAPDNTAKPKAPFGNAISGANKTGGTTSGGNSKRKSGDLEQSNLEFKSPKRSQLSSSGVETKSDRGRPRMGDQRTRGIKIVLRRSPDYRGRQGDRDRAREHDRDRPDRDRDLGRNSHDRDRDRDRSRYRDVRDGVGNRVTGGNSVISDYDENRDRDRDRNRNRNRNSGYDRDRDRGRGRDRLDNRGHDRIDNRALAENRRDRDRVHQPTSNDSTSQHTYNGSTYITYMRGSGESSRTSRNVDRGFPSTQHGRGSDRIFHRDQHRNRTTTGYGQGTSSDGKKRGRDLLNEKLVVTNQKRTTSYWSTAQNESNDSQGANIQGSCERRDGCQFQYHCDPPARSRVLSRRQQPRRQRF